MERRASVRITIELFFLFLLLKVSQENIEGVHTATRSSRMEGGRAGVGHACVCITARTEQHVDAVSTAVRGREQQRRPPSCVPCLCTLVPRSQQFLNTISRATQCCEVHWQSSLFVCCPCIIVLAVLALTRGIKTLVSEQSQDSSGVAMDSSPVGSTSTLCGINLGRVGAAREKGAEGVGAVVGSGVHERCVPRSIRRIWGRVVVVAQTCDRVCCAQCCCEVQCATSSVVHCVRATAGVLERAHRRDVVAHRRKHERRLAAHITRIHLCHGPRCGTIFFTTVVVIIKVVKVATAQKQVDAVDGVACGCVVQGRATVSVTCVHFAAPTLKQGSNTVVCAHATRDVQRCAPFSI